jgi:hypothetical protein
LRFSRVALHISQAGAAEENRIECRAEAQRCSTVSGGDGTLVEQSR